MITFGIFYFVVMSFDDLYFDKNNFITLDNENEYVSNIFLF